MTRLHRHEVVSADLWNCDFCTDFGPFEKVEFEFFTKEVIDQQAPTETYSVRFGKESKSLVYCMRREGMEHLISIVKIDGTRGRSRQRETILDSLSTWPQRETPMNMTYPLVMKMMITKITEMALEALSYPQSPDHKSCAFGTLH